MRQVILFGLGALTILQCVGCDNRTPKVISSKASPDGRHVIWITEERGGLRSGVTSVHLTQSGGKPEAKNAILTSPECEGAQVAWKGNGDIIISYDEIYGTFHSKLRAFSPKVFIIDKKDVKKLGYNLTDYLVISCNTF
jgi:hypothetical protein